MARHLFSLGNLAHFVDETIYQRGLDYFRNGKVVDLYEVQEGKWSARVVGTQSYTVYAQVKQGKVFAIGCNCPFAEREICKHAVAVLLALPPRYKEANEPLFLDNEEDDDLNLLVSSFHKKMMAGLRSFTGRRRIEYGELYAALEDTFDLLREAQKNHGKNPRTSSAIALAALKTLAIAIHQGDDDGEISDGTDQVFALLAAIPPHANEQLRSELFVLLLQNSCDTSLHGWGWETDLLAAAIPLIADNNDEKKFYSTLTKLAGTLAEPSAYFEDQLLTLKILLVKQRHPEKLEEFLRQNLSSAIATKKLIELLLATNQTTKAKLIAKDAIALRGNQWSASDYYEYLITIAKRERNQKEASEALASLFLITGDFSTYNQLKKLTSIDEWHVLVEQFLHAAETNHRISTSEILLQEERSAELMQYLTKNRLGHNLERYEKVLLPQFLPELTRLAKEHLMLQLVFASSRKQYRNAATLLRTISKRYSMAAAQEIKAEIITLYPKKTALLEELARVCITP